MKRTPPRIPPTIAPMVLMARPEGPLGVEIAGYVVVAEAGDADVVEDIFQLATECFLL